MKAEDVIGTIESVLNKFDASSFMLRMRRIHDIEKTKKKWSKKKWLKHVDSRKKENVKERLQKKLKEKLAEAFKTTYPDLKWGIEHPLNDCGDSADIYASDLRKYPNLKDSHDWEIIIEIDTARADQVGKKFVSRFAHILKKQPKNVVYMVLCYYSKTYNKKSSEDFKINDECRKYINYGEELLKKVHGNAFFISAFVDNDKIEIEKLPQFPATPSSAQV
jgi:hypothetical protein